MDRARDHRRQPLLLARPDLAPRPLILARRVGALAGAGEPPLAVSRAPRPRPPRRPGHRDHLLAGQPRHKLAEHGEVADCHAEASPGHIPCDALTSLAVTGYVARA